MLCPSEEKINSLHRRDACMQYAAQEQRKVGVVCAMLQQHDHPRHWTALHCAAPDRTAPHLGTPLGEAVENTGADAAGPMELLA